jgi:DNA-directed RNA polymerase subunit RPC12/RpoP
MTYVCIECGAEYQYEDLLRSKMKCNSCTEKRSNIWVKKRPTELTKKIIAR